ncbi:MAG: hypothetical protein FJ216_06480 [Ignavibacteria bacterium]|nr:hypothetical protein [Ignavibacteria bacterium]
MKYFLVIAFILILFSGCSSQMNDLNSRIEWEVLSTNITDDLHDIEFINDNTGFVYSYGTGKIYKTTDSGNKWALVKKLDSVYLEQIQFVNSNTGWFCGEWGILYKTTDGGNNWTDYSLYIDAGNLLLYGMYFESDAVGYLSGGILFNKEITPKFLVTSNGGMNFNFVNIIPDMLLNIEKFNSGLIGTGDGIIINITDNGNNYDYLFKDDAEQTGQIRDIEFSDNNNGIAVSFQGKALITKDGGNNWFVKEITKNRLRNIKYIGNNRWLTCGDNNKNDGTTLFVSRDNGLNWEKCMNDFPDIHRICLSETYIWLAGKKGFVARTKK